MMLTDERLKVLPDWIAPIAADLDWRCHHEQYAVGRDVSHEAQQLRIIVEYANALLARQRDRKRLRRVLRVARDERIERRKAVEDAEYWADKYSNTEPRFQSCKSALSEAETARDALTKRLKASQLILREARKSWASPNTDPLGVLESLAAALRGRGDSPPQPPKIDS